MSKLDDARTFINQADKRMQALHDDHSGPDPDSRLVEIIGDLIVTTRLLADATEGGEGFNPVQAQAFLR